HLVDAVLDDRMRLAAADFHDLPRPRGDFVNLARHSPSNFAVAEFVEVSHARYFFPRSCGSVESAVPGSEQLPSGHADCGRWAARANASSSLASSSSRTPMARKSASVCSAVASSILEMAKPTWTMA